MAECRTHSESERLDALYRYNVLDTGPEEAFDRITRVVKNALQMPMVIVSFVAEDRQWFKAKQGLKVNETRRDISFCHHTIGGVGPFIVNDALADPRFAENPLVLGEPHIRFYIGVPLRTRDGYNIGSLCSMDTKVRRLSDAQLEIMEDLAKLVVDELELRLLASTDSLTGALNRRSFDDQTNREIERANRYGNSLSCAVIDIDHFKWINDSYGHSVGDAVIQRVISIFRSELRASEYIGRIGGEEFAVIFPETPLREAVQIAERIRTLIAATAIDESGHKIRVTVSIGVAGYGGETKTDRLIHQADVAMYRAKAAGRNRVICNANDDVGVPAEFVVEDDAGGVHFDHVGEATG
jgi:diguanylate cyclase (GGDEF)-like protein